MSLVPFLPVYMGQWQNEKASHTFQGKWYTDKKSRAGSGSNLEPYTMEYIFHCLCWNVPHDADSKSTLFSTEPHARSTWPLHGLPHVPLKTPNKICNKIKRHYLIFVYLWCHGYHELEKWVLMEKAARIGNDQQPLKYLHALFYYTERKYNNNKLYFYAVPKQLCERYPLFVGHFF